jgi:hypothetical protein
LHSRDFNFVVADRTIRVGGLPRRYRDCGVC